MVEPFRAEPGLVTLAVRVTPNASKTVIAGVLTLPDGRAALAIRVAAPPVDGAANVALVRFLAKRLDLPRRAVTVAAGSTGRLKTVRLAGDDAAILARLRAL